MSVICRCPLFPESGLTGSTVSRYVSSCHGGNLKATFLLVVVANFACKTYIDCFQKFFVGTGYFSLSQIQ